MAALEQVGVPRAKFLSAAQLHPEQLASAEGRIARVEIDRLCELAMDLTADPGFGLHWAERMIPHSFNPIAALIAHSATLRQGLEALLQFHPLLSDHSSFQLFERNDQVTIRYLALEGESLALRRFTSEVLMCGLARQIRSFGVHATLERVSFEYAAPSHHTEYARVFEQVVHFDQPFTGIVFDRALMDTASPHKDEDVHDALRATAERQIVRLTQRAPFALRVRELLVRQGSAHRSDMKTAAHSLGLSVRSLRRRLAAEGTSYQAIANEALASVAKHLLRDEQRTIQETAFEMGFSDASTFHRAFKSWTGTTPRACRNAEPPKSMAPDELTSHAHD
jgi:AraC-like DNA-binding protein